MQSCAVVLEEKLKFVTFLQQLYIARVVVKIRLINVWPVPRYMQSIWFIRNSVQSSWDMEGNRNVTRSGDLDSKGYTANVNSSITDKLRFLSVISKQTHLFWNIFENCFNHRKMSVKIKIKNNTQQKTEKFLSLWKSSNETTIFFL